MIREAISGHAVMESLFTSADRLLPCGRRWKGLTSQKGPKRYFRLRGVIHLLTSLLITSHLTWPDISIRFWAERTKKYFSEKEKYR